MSMEKLLNLSLSDQNFLDDYLKSIMGNKLSLGLFMEMQEWEDRNGPFQDYIGVNHE